MDVQLLKLSLLVNDDRLAEPGLEYKTGRCLFELLLIKDDEDPYDFMGALVAIDESNAEVLQF
jgi:hypothetical protein